MSFRAINRMGADKLAQDFAKPVINELDGCKWLEGTKVIQKLIIRPVQLYQPSEWFIKKNTKYKNTSCESPRTDLLRIKHQPVKAKTRKTRRGSGRHRTGSQSSQNSLSARRKNVLRSRSRNWSLTSQLSRSQLTHAGSPAQSMYLKLSSRYEHPEEESLPEHNVSNSSLWSLNLLSLVYRCCCERIWAPVFIFTVLA